MKEKIRKSRLSRKLLYIFTFKFLLDYYNEYKNFDFVYRYFYKFEKILYKQVLILFIFSYQSA